MLERDDDDTESRQRPIPVLRYFTVFNVEQCDNLTKLAPLTEADRISVDPIPACQAIVDGMPNRPAIRHGGDRAYYAPAADYVQLPQAEAFDSMAEYYGVAFHELGHSTGHSTRLDRGLDASDRLAAFGSEDYSREELVAEMTSAYLLGHAGIETGIPNSAAYIKSWLRAIKADPKALVVAGGKAQKAADYVLGATAEAI